MADNYLEKHYEEYLKRKAEWERKGKKVKTAVNVRNEKKDEKD